MKTTYKITIRDIAYGGQGVGKLDDGRICFVAFSAIDDEVEVKIKREQKRFVEAQIISFAKKSASRVEPKCQYFGTCGGCSYQHISYKEQLKIKKSQFLSVLKRVGNIKFDDDINFIESDKQYTYRNKLRLSPYKDENNQLNYGLYSYDNKQIIPISQCLLVSEKINKKIKVLGNGAWGQKNAKVLKPAKATIRQAYGEEPVIFYGKKSPNFPWLKEPILNRNFRIPLESFFQVNHAVAKKLLDVVSTHLQNLPTRIVIDAFCGAGFLSINTDKKVIGIEQDNLAVQAAKFNAKEFGTKAHYLTGNVAKHLLKQLERYKLKKTTLILDPPRQGCDKKTLQAISAGLPHSLIYVSCDCATLARDLKQLSKHYQIAKITLLDMFAQTAHFESVVLLTKKGVKVNG